MTISTVPATALIMTQYRGATDTKGARIVVSNKADPCYRISKYRSMTVSYDYSLNDYANHVNALQIYLDKGRAHQWERTSVRLRSDDVAHMISADVQEYRA